MTTAAEVLAFWLEEVGEKGWYIGGEALDSTIRSRFLAVWQEAGDGLLTHWQADARGVLAYLIVTDQLGRNMHRDTALAFGTDPLAHAAADRAIALGWDKRITGPERRFFYMPFMHAETIPDQSRSVSLFALLSGPQLEGNLLHARAHREVIRRFGRFPTRNAALGRQTTAAEAAYLAEGGYGAIIRALKG